MNGAVVACAVALFMIACAAVEWARPKLRGEPISSGLNGRYHLYLIAGFFALAAGLWYGAATMMTGWQIPVAVIAGCAIAGAAISDGWGYLRPLEPVHHTVHLACAGAAFIAAAVLEAMLVYTTRSPLLAALFALYPTATGFVWWEWREDTQLQEKVAVGAICAFLLAWSI